MTTLNPRFQAGDVIRCGSAVRTIESVHSSGRSDHGRTEWYRFVPRPWTADGYGDPDSTVAARNGELSISYTDDNYTLVERPGDTPGEEVKQMSKFNAGDTIRYNNGTDTLRVVLAVDVDEYVVSGRLSGPFASDRDVYSFGFIDDNYDLLVAAPVSTTVTDAHKADMATLSAKLAAEARRRGWCSEYQGVINGWNADLTIPLDPYPSTSVTTQATITLTLVRTDEIDNGQSPADHAYDLYWGTTLDNLANNVTVPGWTVTGGVRDNHTHTTS